jgi:hypothetical protein
MNFIFFETCHSKKKGEFESPRNECLCFKGGTPIMLGPLCAYNLYIIFT